MRLAAVFIWMPLAVLIGAGCAVRTPQIPVNTESVNPGEAVTRGSLSLSLLGTPISVGMPLPSAALVDSHLRTVDLSQESGAILLLSIVPSLDTQVCERQTHLLGEKANRLPPGIKRIAISRDLPFAQKRFAEEAGISNVWFLSDYRDAAFGRATGLLVDDLMLLARAVIIVDRQGIVRYIQVVPQLGQLPDLVRAFAFAAEMAKR